MGYYDIRQVPLLLAANDKRPVHLIYPFVGKPWPINHCQHLSGLPPPGFVPHHYDSSTFAHYFVDKIVILRDSVSNTLCALSVSVPSDLSFPSHRGSVLDILSPVTSDEVGRVLASSPAKSSTMDIILTSLVLRCKAVFL